MNFNREDPVRSGSAKSGKPEVILAGACLVFTSRASNYGQLHVGVILFAFEFFTYGGLSQK